MRAGALGFLSRSRARYLSVRFIDLKVLFVSVWFGTGTDDWLPVFYSALSYVRSLTGTIVAGYFNLNLTLQSRRTCTT